MFKLDKILYVLSNLGNLTTCITLHSDDNLKPTMFRWNIPEQTIFDTISI